MKKLIRITLFASFILAPIASVNSNTFTTVVDPITANGLTVWDTFNGTNFVIQASILNAGVWGSVTTISDPTISSQNPLAATNQDDRLVVVWQGTDIMTGMVGLYGTTYDVGLATWATPVLISHPLESVWDFYNVNLSDSGAIAVTYVSYISFAGLYAVRAVFNPTYGTWTAPVTIGPY